MRKKTIVSRGSFEGALTTARVIQQVVDATSTYLGTITLINVGLGALTARRPVVARHAVAGHVGRHRRRRQLHSLPRPDRLRAAAVPRRADDLSRTSGARCCRRRSFIGFHLVEANFFTPMVVGHRLTISPLSILISLSFWAWVWGTTGALLAVPLLIIMKTIFSAAGTPDIAGFLFEHGTLTHVGDPDEEEEDERQEMEPAMVDTPKALS